MRGELDGALVTRINLRGQVLDRWPELTEEVQTLNDSLAGLDDFEEQCLAVLRDALRREAMAKGLGGLIEEMQARKRRLDEGAKFLRVAVLNAIQEAGVPRITAPDMTVSVGRAKPRVVITDEAALPDNLCQITRTPDKTAIAAALATGDVPGAMLGNPAVFLSVRKS